jgi:hypothetical protein
MLRYGYTTQSQAGNRTQDVLMRLSFTIQRQFLCLRPVLFDSPALVLGEESYSTGASMDLSFYIMYIPCQSSTYHIICEHFTNWY